MCVESVVMGLGLCYVKRMGGRGREVVVASKSVLVMS